MRRENTAARNRRAAAGRRVPIWMGVAVLAVGALIGWSAWTGPGGPPPSRPPGAGLPPQLARSTLSEAEAVAVARRAEIAAEEARLAALRAARAQLEQEVAALRQAAEQHRRDPAARKPGETTGAAAPPGAAGGPEPPSPPLRVFVHHRAGSPPAAAEEVAQGLRGAGVEVQAIRAAPFVPSTPVVRYFHDEDQAAAARLAARLGRGWAIQDFRAYLPQPPPQTLEIWLPAS
jgi:cell division protein FtsB